MNSLLKKKLFAVVSFTLIALIAAYITGTHIDSIFLWLILGSFAIVQIINFITGEPFLLAGPGYLPEGEDKFERSIGIIGIIILGLFCLHQLYDAML
ncbi:MAG: hypothetical protein RQ867_04695 [Mariprofundaceae bacterium]|nr:hypothetical protein [Mariprofundaceae bacterium]